MNNGTIPNDQESLRKNQTTLEMKEKTHNHNLKNDRLSRLETVRRQNE